MFLQSGILFPQFLQFLFPLHRPPVPLCSIPFSLFDRVEFCFCNLLRDPDLDLVLLLDSLVPDDLLGTRFIGRSGEPPLNPRSEERRVGKECRL